MKLTLDKDTERRLKQILAPFRKPDAWRSYGLDYAPNPYAVVLFQGMTGTGKTTLAKYLGRCLGYSDSNPMPTVTYGELATEDLGGTEKNIMEVFKPKPKAILFDEVDALVWSRSRVTDDTMYELGFVNTFLTEIDKFIRNGGLLCMTTNYGVLLDEALLSRVTDRFELHPPTGEMAIRLWKTKLPVNHGLSSVEIEHLAHRQLTPRDIEASVLRACRESLITGERPTAADYS